MDTLNIKKKFKNSCLFLVAIRVLILIGMLGYSSASYSQIGTVYPMDINVMMTPPYSTCLYENVGNGRFQCNVLMRDMRGSNHPFKIKMVVKDAASGRAKFSAMSKIHTIQAGQVAYMANDNVLAEILDDPNAVKFMNNGCLPEGSYEFVFQLVDAKDSRNIPISKEFVLLARLNAGNAPLLFFPQNGDTIGRPLADGICSETVVNFSWNVGAANGNFNTYKFEITSVPEGAKEEDILNQKDVNLGYEESYVYMPMITLAQSTSRFSTHNTKYAWRVTICDEKRQPRTNYSNKGASEVFSFVYCGEPVQLEPYVPKTGPIVKAIADDLDPLEIDSIDTTNVSAKAFWRYNKDLISEKNYSGYIVEIVKCGLDTWTPNTISDPADTSFAFSNLKYNEKYCARAQYYIELGEGEKKYGPYGEIDTFLIPNPVDTVDCGELKGPAECEEGEEFQVVKKYGVIIANGTPVTVDSITSYSADSSEISGFGYVAFPILSNFKLRMNFENIKVNCRGELVKGKIHSVYDESRAAIIDLNHIFGKGEGGGAPSQTTETSMTSFDSEESAKKNTSVGDFAEVEGKIYVKAPDGSMVEVGSKLSLTAEQYSSQDVLDNDKVFVVFHNDTEKHEYIAFDADENKVYRKVAVLASHYESFSKQAGNSNEYIVPWVASNPGRVVGLSATMEGAKFSDYNAVKFVTPLSGGDYLELKATLSGDKYLVDLPGKTPNTNTAVYVIAQKTSSDPFVNVGKIKIENYEYRNQKVKFVPVLKNYEVDKDAIAGYLNMVYGRFGITFTVDVEDPIESSRIEELVSEGFALKTDGMFAKESNAMLELQHEYRTIRGLEQMEDSTVYFFLLEQPSDYTGVAGDMPQNRNCGYIFMDGKSTLSDGRLVAHEIAHGVYNLDHIFEKAYGIKQGTTDNLLDYNDGNQLAQYQWNLIKEPGFAWALFEKDEDNQAIPPCLYKSAASLVGNSVVSGLVDYGINQAIGSDIDKEKTLGECIGEGFSDNFTVANTLRTVAETCFKLDDYAHYISMLFNAGSSANDYFDCRDGGGDFCHCLTKSVTNFLLSTLIDEVKKKLSDKISKKYPKTSDENKKAICDKVSKSMLDYLNINSQTAVECVSAISEGLFDGMKDGADSKISGKIVEKLSDVLADIVCKDSDSPKLEDIRIAIDRDRTLHVYLYTKISKSEELNKTRAIVKPTVTEIDENEPCNKDKYETKALNTITLTSNYFNYDNLPGQKWYETDESFLSKLSYSKQLSYECKMDGETKDVLAFVFKDKYCSVNDITSDKLRLYEVGVMTVTVEKFNWDGDYYGWFVNKSKVLDQRVYHYMAKLPCQDDKIYLASVWGEGRVVNDKDNYVNAKSDTSEYHCGKALPDCRDDDNGGGNGGGNNTPKTTVTKKDECSKSDLFKRSATTSSAAIAAANKARIDKGECVYGLPKCSEWRKDDNNNKVYHINSPSVCANYGETNSKVIENLYTVTLKNAGVPEKGSRVMNNDVAMNNLFSVFSYECGVDSMLVEDTIPEHAGRAIMVSADQYFAKYALRIFTKVTRDWAEYRKSYHSPDNNCLDKAFTELKNNWKKKDAFPSPIVYALDRPTGNDSKGPRHLMKILENSSYYSQLQQKLSANLKSGNEKIDFCNLCVAFRNIYRMVALSLAKIPYSYKDHEFMYRNQVIPSQYSSSTSEYKYLYNNLFVTTAHRNPNVASSSRNRSIYYTQEEADEINKQRLKNIENALSLFTATIFDDVHSAASSTMSVEGHQFQYIPNDLSIKTVANMAVQVNGDSCK